MKQGAGEVRGERWHLSLPACGAQDLSAISFLRPLHQVTAFLEIVTTFQPSASILVLATRLLQLMLPSGPLTRPWWSFQQADPVHQLPEENPACFLFPLEPESDPKQGVTAFTLPVCT